MIGSLSEFESTPSYPTKGDIENLRLIVQTKANGANFHAVTITFAELQNIFEQAKDEGWDLAKLEAYNRAKRELNTLLLGGRRMAA